MSKFISYTTGLECNGYNKIGKMIKVAYYRNNDGALVAKRLGITLPPAQVPYNISAKVDAKYAALVKDL